MKLWPFPKKSEVATSQGICDLPEGVMLALPDEEPASDATVPSYARPDTGHPPTDPAAAIEQPQESTRLSPIASSGNTAMDEEFNKLFSANAPSLSLPATETPALGLSPLQDPGPDFGHAAGLAEPVHPNPVPLVESKAPDILPMPAVQAEAPISENQKTEAALENLLAQLSQAAPSSPKPIDLSAFNDEPLAPPVAAKAESDVMANDWDLAPMENPPMSSDWSLVGDIPTTPAFTAEESNGPCLSDLQPDTSLSQTPLASDQPELSGHEEAPLAPASSLIDSLSTPTTLENPISPAAIELENVPRQNSQPPAQKPAAAPRGSMLDTLIPSPSTGAEMGYGIAPEPTQEFSPAFNAEVANFNTMEGWEASASQDDFAMIPPPAQEWMEATPSFDLGLFAAENDQPHQPAADYAFSASLPIDEQDEFALPDYAMENAACETMADCDMLEIEADEDSWSEDDLIPESANLNSSDAAYDLNHYDDPDEPAQAIELDDEPAAPDHLQAMAKMLSQLKSEPPAQPQVAATQHSPSPKVEANPAFGQASNTLESLFDEVESVDSGYAPDYSTESVPEPATLAKPYAAANDESKALPAYAYSDGQAACSSKESAPSLTQGTKPAHYAPQEEHTIYADAADMQTEAGENDMLKLTGNKAAPEHSILEAISAKFIARPRQDTPNTKAAQDIPESLSEQIPTEAQADDRLIDPTGLMEQLPTSKIKPPTLSQAMSNFEEEMLLKETRFVRQSINNLVDRYFAQQEQDHSC